MRARHTLGFTLIELMIVIGIIVVLVAVLAVALSGVMGKSEEAQTKATIETLKSNIESYKTRWGQAPPTTLRDLGQIVGVQSMADPNDQNVGIETLVIALRSRREQGPYLDAPLFADDKRRTNLDIDTLIDAAFAPTALDIEDATARDLFEFVDAWGNPLVYLNIADVRLGGFRYTVTKADGSTEPIDPLQAQDLLRHPTTGSYPADYVLWSFGENGINEYGRGDDITSWEKYAE